MRTPQEWNRILAPDESAAVSRNAVHVSARAYLAGLETGDYAGTEQLVEALYPRAVAEKSLAGDCARTRIYKLLALLATNGLEDCCVKGEVNGQFMGRAKRPWLWFNPGDLEMCCMCGQPVPKDDGVKLAETCVSCGTRDQELRQVTRRSAWAGDWCNVCFTLGEPTVKGFLRWEDCTVTKSKAGG